MTKIIHTFLKDITDPDILTLLRELEKTTHVKLTAFPNSMVIHYLEQCVYPNGANTEQVPINQRALDSTDDFLNEFFLRKQIKKLRDTSIYTLCHELSQIKGKSVEHVTGKHLYVFFNEHFKQTKKKKKKGPLNILWK